MRLYSLDISVNLRRYDDKRHTIFHSISRTWSDFSPHYRYVHSGQGNYQLQIANCLIYGILACMCHSYCGGIVNVHLREQYPSYWYKQKINDEYLHIVFTLFSIQYLHKPSSRLQTLQFIRCSILDGSSSESSTCIITTRWRNTYLSVPLTYDLWYLLVKPN